MILAAVQQAHVVVDKALTISDSGWAIFAACAAAGAAIATGILAFITRNLAKATSEMSSATKKMVEKTGDLAKETAIQVEATKDILANENVNHRLDISIALTNQYIQVGVPITGGVPMTPLEAVSLVDAASERMEAVRILKAKYNPAGQSAEDEYYRRLAACFTIITNFYETVAQLQRRQLLDEPFVLEHFARPFLTSLRTMTIVNAEVNAIDASVLTKFDDFKRVCEAFAQREGAPDTGGDGNLSHGGLAT